MKAGSSRPGRKAPTTGLAGFANKNNTAAAVLLLLVALDFIYVDVFEVIFVVLVRFE